MTRNENQKRPDRQHQPPAFIAWHVDEKGEKKFWNPHRRRLAPPERARA